MLLKAAEEFNIDLNSSYMIGDSESDIKAGIAAGCKSVLVNGFGSLQNTGDYGQLDKVDSVLDFVKRYL